MGFAPGGFARVNTRLFGSPAFTETPLPDRVAASHVELAHTVFTGQPAVAEG